MLFHGEFYIASAHNEQFEALSSFMEEDYNTLLIIGTGDYTSLIEDGMPEILKLVEGIEPTGKKEIFVYPYFNETAKEFIKKHWGMLAFF